MNFSATKQKTNPFSNNLHESEYLKYLVKRIYIFKTEEKGLWI